jgi:hypothetical protein
LRVAGGDRNEVRSRKHVVAQMIDVVPHPVVRTEDCLHMPPRALDRVRTSGRRRT